MQKSPLIGVNICVACVIVLASCTNVVGVQTVQSSNQKIISNEVDQKELLFQTIVDMANDKEIQKIISTSEMRREGFFTPSSNFLVFTPPVLTKKFLNTAYHIGLILSKTISKSKMQSILERYQVNNQEMQKEITAVIEKDATLKEEITQLSSSTCDCEKGNTTGLWNFPILCTILYPITFFLFCLGYFSAVLLKYVPLLIETLLTIMISISQTLNCYWTRPW